MYNKAVSILFLMTLIVTAGYTQQLVNTNTEDKIWDNYSLYRERTIFSRFFKHSDIVPLIQKHAGTGRIKNEIAGKSVQGRSIHHLSAGTGPIKVLLWSQMHGDESTATMAIFDLLNFLTADDQFNDFRNNLLSKLNLHFVPMLNPDGAQIWTRRNVMDIDINRDAQNLATPEAKILMDLGKALKPQFGFNLHDQSIYYAAGDTGKPATISFLAPAFNKAKDMNEIRSNAVKVIATMNKALQSKEPGQVAKYDDTFDARCFGDQFMSMGISSILIESGGYLHDPEKQHIRKLNFYALINALNAIAEASYQKEEPENYWTLPDNKRNLYDLIVRNLWLPGENDKMDMGILRVQQIDTSNYKNMIYKGKLEKIDGEEKYGYQEIDAKNMLYLDGNFGGNYRSKPDEVNFILYEGNHAKYVVLNGYLFDMEISVERSEVIIAAPPPPKRP